MSRQPGCVRELGVRDAVHGPGSVFDPDAVRADQRVQQHRAGGGVDDGELDRDSAKVRGLADDGRAGFEARRGPA